MIKNIQMKIPQSVELVEVIHVKNVRCAGTKENPVGIVE